MAYSKTAFFHTILIFVTATKLSSSEVQPHQMSRPPEVTYVSKNCNSTDRGVISLCCIANGFPAPTVSWRSRGGRLLPQKTWTLKNETWTVLSLAEIDVREVNGAAGEKVFCEATNALGRDKAELEITHLRTRSRGQVILSDQSATNNTCEYLIRVVYGTGVISLAVGAVFAVIFMKLMDCYIQRKRNAERLPLNRFRRK